LSGGDLILTWPQDHIGWTLRSQTNSLAVGLSSSWVAVAGSSGTNKVIMPMDKTQGAVFFRRTHP